MEIPSLFLSLTVPVTNIMTLAKTDIWVSGSLWILYNHLMTRFFLTATGSWSTENTLHIYNEVDYITQRSPTSASLESGCTGSKCFSLPLCGTFPLLHTHCNPFCLGHVWGGGAVSRHALGPKKNPSMCMRNLSHTEHPRKCPPANPRKIPLPQTPKKKSRATTKPVLGDC